MAPISSSTSSGKRHDVEGRHPDVFGEGAGHVDADAARLRIEVEFARARGAALHADDVALAGDALADLEIAHVAADLDDLAGIFMADDHRHRNRLLRPGIPFVDVDIGAANAGLAHLDQHVVLADGRHGLALGQPQAGLGLQFDESFHGDVQGLRDVAGDDR